MQWPPASSHVRTYVWMVVSLERNRTPERYVLAKKSPYADFFFPLCEADFYPDFRTDLRAAGFKVAFLSGLSNTLWKKTWALSKKFWALNCAIFIRTSKHITYIWLEISLFLSGLKICGCPIYPDWKQTSYWVLGDLQGSWRNTMAMAVRATWTYMTGTSKLPAPTFSESKHE